MTTFDLADSGLVPAELVALTVNEYAVFPERPVMVTLVAVPETRTVPIALFPR